MVRHGAFNVSLQFDEPNNRETTVLNQIYYYRVTISGLCTFLRMLGGGASILRSFPIIEPMTADVSLFSIVPHSTQHAFQVWAWFYQL